METNTQTPLKKTPPTRPSPMGWWLRAIRSESRRFYYGMTRENIASFLKTMAWAVPLTILIWVYAESQEQVPDDNQPIAIEIKSRDPNKIVTLNPGEHTITCDLLGPRSNLDRFKSMVSNLTPIVIELDTRNMSDHEEYITTLDKLSQSPQIQEAGITVQKCEPAQLRVTVDTLVSRNLPVKAPDVAGLHDATFDPPTVSVSGPRRFLSTVTEVEADISSLPELNVPGAHPAVTVSLLQDSSGMLTYEPSQVKAILTVDQKTQTQHISAVITLDVSPGFGDKYSIAPRYPVVQLDVAGPPEQVAKLKDIVPHALLEVNDSNVNDTGAVPLTIVGLPPGVHVVGAAPTMAFTATSRQ